MLFKRLTAVEKKEDHYLFLLSWGASCMTDRFLVVEELEAWLSVNVDCRYWNCADRDEVKAKLVENR